MTILPAVLQGGVVLGTAPGALYTAPPGVYAVVKRAVFTNATAAAVTATVTITRAGGDALTIISAQPVAANAASVAPELANLVLGPGDAVSASCSAAGSVAAVMSGFTL